MSKFISPYATLTDVKTVSDNDKDFLSGTVTVTKDIPAEQKIQIAAEEKYDNTVNRVFIRTLEQLSFGPKRRIIVAAQKHRDTRNVLDEVLVHRWHDELDYVEDLTIRVRKRKGTTLYSSDKSTVIPFGNSDVETVFTKETYKKYFLQNGSEKIYAQFDFEEPMATIECSLLFKKDTEQSDYQTRKVTIARIVVENIGPFVRARVYLPEGVEGATVSLLEKTKDTRYAAIQHGGFNTKELKKHVVKHSDGSVTEEHEDPFQALVSTEGSQAPKVRPKCDTCYCDTVGTGAMNRLTELKNQYGGDVDKIPQSDIDQLGCGAEPPDRKTGQKSLITRNPTQPNGLTLHTLIQNFQEVTLHVIFKKIHSDDQRGLSDTITHTIIPSADNDNRERSEYLATSTISTLSHLLPGSGEGLNSAFYHNRRSANGFDDYSAMTLVGTETIKEFAVTLGKAGKWVYANWDSIKKMPATKFNAYFAFRHGVD
ncbi:MAG: hypothetical protein GY817_02715, partial [bacterium]|nr:hypothetical protein [bacterium]